MNDKVINSIVKMFDTNHKETCVAIIMVEKGVDKSTALAMYKLWMEADGYPSLLSEYFEDVSLYKCPHGGDETDCGSCIYNVDHEWDEDAQDCVRKNKKG